MNRKILLLAGCVFFIFACKELKVTTSDDAALLGATLANEQCQSSFQKQPFLPTHYKAEFKFERWYWGRLDMEGIDGYAAEVSFNKDGQDRKVKVYYISDSLSFKPSAPTPVMPDPVDK